MSHPEKDCTSSLVVQGLAACFCLEHGPEDQTASRIECLVDGWMREKLISQRR
jgi:hypothetical protein